MLDLSTHHNMEDIEIFLQSCMSNICLCNLFLQLMHTWLEYEKICVLAMWAAGRFIWVSTACLFIRESHGCHDPPKCLDMLLQGNIDANAQLAFDDLYATALESVDNRNDEDFQLDFLSIMGHHHCRKESPL